MNKASSEIRSELGSHSIKPTCVSAIFEIKMPIACTWLSRALISARVLISVRDVFMPCSIPSCRVHASPTTVRQPVGGGEEGGELTGVDRGHGQTAQQEQQPRRTQTRVRHPPAASSSEPSHPAWPIYDLPSNGTEPASLVGAGERGPLLLTSLT